tara:strand:+ start:132 stop:431 length:300 start_codon:yes stop_codon:yes gene_type:complete
MSSSDVKFSTRTSDGRFGKEPQATDNFLGRVRVQYIQGAGVASSLVKLYDGTDATGVLKYQAGFGAEGLDVYVPNDGLVFENGVFIDLTNTTSVTIAYN